MIRHRQSGFSLLEVLIAVLVLSFGLLGIAGMQAAALRNNQSAAERSQVVFMTYSILDAMRANINTATDPHSFRPTEYTSILGTFVCAAPTGSTLAAKDAIRWINNLHANLGSSACGQVSCIDNSCTVSIRWNDSRGTGGGDAQIVETRSQL